MARASTFTSYINTELPSNVDANFARLEQVATKTYSNIQRSAESATRSAAGLLSGRGTAGGGAVTKGLQQQAAAARAVADVNGQVSRSAIRTTEQLKQEGNAAERAARQNSTFVRSLTAVGTSLNVVQGPLGPLAGRITALSRAATELTGLRLGLAGVAGSLFVIGSMGNTYQALTAQVRGAYEAQADQSRATNDIVSIANRARTSLSAISGLYIRISQAADAAGISQQRASRVTELAAKAAKLSGGQTSSQDAALVQFTQAYGANFQGGGQELQSILEGANQLAASIAKGLGVPIGQLKVLGEQGKLTTEVVTQALERSANDIERRYAAMPKTLGQATTEFTNDLTVMVGQIDQAIGFTGTLAGVISSAAGSLHFLASAAVGVGVAFASIKIGGFVTDLTASVRQTMVMQAAITQLGIRRQQVAEQSLAQHLREQAALEAEQAQIQENIALLQRKVQLDAQDVRHASNPAAFTAAINAEKDSLAALAQERQRGNVIAVAQEAANGRVIQSTNKLAEATTNVEGRQSLLRRTVGGLIGAINPLGIAVGILTTALIYLATKSTSTDEILAQVGDTAIETARKALKLAAANNIVAQSYYNIARAAGQKEVREAGETRTTNRNELVGRLSLVAQRLGSSGPASPQGQAAQQLRNLASEFQKGFVEVGDVLPKVAALQKKYPWAFGNGRLFGAQLGTDTSREGIEKNAIAFFAATEKYKSAVEEMSNIDKAIKEQQKPIQLGGNTGAKVSDLQTQAQAEALDKGTASIRAAGIRRRDALRQLNDSLGVQNGKVTPDKVDEYRNKAAEIERTYNTEVEGIRNAAKARTAAASQARHEAQVAKADARQGAEDKLGAGLLDLETNKATMGVEDYNAARLTLLDTYDKEIAALDDTAAHSSRATAQQIKDVRALAAAAVKKGERRQDILGSWSDEPKAFTRARDQIDDLNKMVDTYVNGLEAVTKDNPLGRGLYTQVMADADARRIWQGVGKPYRDAIDQGRQFTELAALRVQGYDAEARALERALDMQRDMGALSQEQFQVLVAQERQQDAINDALGTRERLTQSILGIANQTRDAFEELITSLPERGVKAGGDFFKKLSQQALQIGARKLTEQLFAGSDSKLRGLVSGQNGVEQAYRFLASHATDTGSALDQVTTAATKAAEALNAVGGGGTTPVGSASNQVLSTLNSIGAGLGSGGGSKGALAAMGVLLGGSAGGATDDSIDTHAIQVTGKTLARSIATVVGNGTGGIPTAGQGYNTMFKGFGEQLDKTFGTKSFFKNIGGAVGDALGGAGTGMAVGGILNSIGIKQNQTGAAIGGAIGGLIPIPGGAIIGSILGGTIGTLFDKPKYGGAGISLNEYGQLVGGAGTGRGDQAKAAATGAAGSLATAINQITSALGATVSSLPGVTIGTWDGKYRVARTNTSEPLNGNSSAARAGLVENFGDDQQAAIQYAISYVIGGAVIKGISQASINILKSGQDLQTAIEKATAIEDIPKRLMARLDPVRYAVTQLNAEYVKLIAYLKEGGASAEQFAQAAQLYDLERADAIKQATEQAVGAIQQFMDQMISGPNSPLNKRTVYENAQATLQGLATDVNAGKAVDQNSLLTAAQNFQDASRSLNGSSQTFFSDFNMLYDLLAKAKANVGLGTATDPLPGSPFSSDPSVQSMIDQQGQAQLDATNAQTVALASRLDTIAGLLSGVAGGAPYSGNDDILGLLRMTKVGGEI